MSVGVQLALKPPEVTPATRSPAPKSMNSGPPESPEQVLESSPGAPRGDVNAQHTCVASGMPSVHVWVVTLPVRLIPESSVAPAVMPKPTMLPSVPGAALPVALIGLGATPVTGVAKRMTALSPETAKWKLGLMAKLLAWKKPACWRKTTRFCALPAAAWAQ